MVPLLLKKGAVNAATMSSQPAYHPLCNIEPRTAVVQLLQRPYLQLTSPLTADSSEMDRVVGQLGACLRGSVIKGDTSSSPVLIDNDDEADGDDADEDSSAPQSSSSGSRGGGDHRPSAMAKPSKGSFHEENLEEFQSWGHWQLDRSQVEMQERIGVGEFGEVLRGKLHGTGKHEGMVANVAIKMQTKGDPLEFLHEARTMIQLHQENLVNIYGVCTATPPDLIVIELCEHGSLKSFLSSFMAKNLTVADVRSVIKDICTGMAYVASEGFIHRDLAARNVLVEKPLRAKVRCCFLPVITFVFVVTFCFTLPTISHTISTRLLERSPAHSLACILIILFVVCFFPSTSDHTTTFALFALAGIMPLQSFCHSLNHSKSQLDISYSLFIFQYVYFICTRVGLHVAHHTDVNSQLLLCEIQVSDFGMAVYAENGFYQAEMSQPVPIRWSAPESIMKAHFSHKSDVWSFGIVMYETITFGKELYSGATNKEVVSCSSCQLWG